MIIAITGPAGSGKTTVAEKLAKELKKIVNIDADHIKHMNPGAFAKVTDKDGNEDWPYSAWGLVGENIAILAENFMSHGYDVIINGWLEVEAWKEIEKRIKLDHKLLLLPDEDTNILRDDGRTDEVKMGELAVKRGRKYFDSEPYYSDFIKLDTSSETIEQTVTRIKVLLTK